MDADSASGVLRGYVDRLLCAVLAQERKKLFNISPFTESSKAVSPYMLFYNSVYKFQELAAHFEGLSSPPQQKMHADVDRSVKDGESVGTAAFHHSPSTDYAQCYVTYLIFGRLHSLNLSFNHYYEEEEWYKPLL